eukprot:gene16419-11738_t
MTLKKSIRDGAIGVYRELSRCMLSRDTTTLSQILTDDFHLLHMTGYNQPKREWLAHIDSGRMRYFHSEEPEPPVVQDATENKAIVVAKKLVDADIWGARGNWPLKMKLHCVHQDGQWLIAHIEASTYH